jgi:hypothetical protein
MKVIKYEEDGFLPGILLDPEAGKMILTGRACPEDPTEFYKPVFDWLDEYSKNPKPKTVFEFKLSYYNTATSKILMMILQKMEELSNDGHEVLIRWHFPEDDDDMKEAGEDYSEMVELKFEMVSYQDE